MLRLRVLNEKSPFGDTDQVKILDVDHGRIDRQNALAVITDVEDEDLYKLANENGTLKQMFRWNQFTLLQREITCH